MQLSVSPKIRLALWFSITGDLRFLSHRETMRLWQRVLVRAGIPVRYTQGFNPHPLLSLPLPRSVGLAGEQELLLVKLDHHCPLEENTSRLQDQLPAGLRIIAIRLIPEDIAPQAQWARYRCRLSSSVDNENLNQRINEFEKSTSWQVQRPPHGRHPRRTIDLKKSLIELEQRQEGLFYTIRVSQEATPRNDEILTMLEINDPELVTEVVRLQTGYPAELSLPN